MTKINFFLLALSFLYANIDQSIAFAPSHSRQNAAFTSIAPPRTTKGIRLNVASVEMVIPDKYGGANGTATTSFLPEQEMLQRTEAAATLPSSSAPHFASLSSWQRRLNTKEDAFNVHKIAGIAFMLSSTVILGTGVANGYQSVPNFLEPVQYVFFLSTIFQSLSSVRLAINHRRTEPAMISAFISVATGCTAMSFVNYWLGPFCPSFIAENATISNGVFAVLMGIALLSQLDGMNNADSILESRLNKNNPEENGGALEWFAYMAFLYFGAFQAAHSFLNSFDPIHTREYVLQHVFGPGAAVPVYYNTVVQTISMSYGAFCNTLRDKKLISKQTEQTALGAITLLAFTSQAFIWGLGNLS